MQKFFLTLLIFAGFCFAVPCFAADTNQVVTNQPAGAVGTNSVARPSDAELQAAARNVLRRVIVFGIMVLIGALVVGGFGLYGAYKKFGVVGAIIVGVILAFGVFVFCGFLLLF